MSKRSWVFSLEDPSILLVKEIRQKTGVDKFDLAVVLGSGWGEASQLGEELFSVNYSDWTCFPADQIAGHSGMLSAVRCSSYNILVFSGRFHCYQGLSAFQASFPVRLASSLGCPEVVLTCATGSVNPQFNPGDFMLVDDHINLLGDNPLCGLSGDTFVNLTNAYRQEINGLLLEKHIEGVTLHRGVLAAMPGPSYETPAEIAYLEKMGVDVVSMSTVHETIMARYLDMKVTAIAFIANYAAGKDSSELSHDDVLACSARYASFFPAIISQLIDSVLKTSSNS